MKQSNNKQTQREEQLSALLDDALDEQQLNEFMEDLKRDPIADAETSQRYRLIGDAMRDEMDQASFMDISSAVHRAVENEPSHNEIEASTEKPSSSSLGELFSQWLKPLTGMAVAASVAMVTVVTFNTVTTSDSTNTPQLAQAKVATPVVTPVQQVQPGFNPEIARNVRVASTLEKDKASAEQQKQLNIYMLQHSGYTSPSTMQGMMPNVRAVEIKAQQ